MKEYSIQLGRDYPEIQVFVEAGSGEIHSTLHEDLSEAEDADDLASMKKWNMYMDAIESLVLAHACAGIDVGATKYVEGIVTAYDAYASNEDHQ